VPEHIIFHTYSTQHFNIGRKEVEEICQIGVLESNIYSEWGVPCLFSAKKMAVTDFLQISDSSIISYLQACPSSLN